MSKIWLIKRVYPLQFKRIGVAMETVRLHRVGMSLFMETKILLIL